MGYCVSGPGCDTGPGGAEGEARPNDGTGPQDRTASGQGLSALSAAWPASVAPRSVRQCDRQPVAQSLGVHGDLLRTLPRRGGEVQSGHPGGRGEARVVSATNV